MELPAVVPRALGEYDSCGVELPRAALVQEPQNGFAVDVVRLAARGPIGQHPTQLWQVFLVVSGSGWVSGASGDRRTLQAGEAALRPPEEGHASGSGEGLTAVVVRCRARPLPPEEAP